MSTNPWGISEREAAVLDAMCEHGCQKGAARALGIAVKTVQVHCYNAGVRMQVRGTIKASGSSILKYLAWDRWRRGQAS